MNTKKKEDKSKLNRGTGQAVEENDDIDFSLLRKPILTSITGFAQARKIFDQATEEVINTYSKICKKILYKNANYILKIFVYIFSLRAYLQMNVIYYMNVRFAETYLEA